VPDCQAMQTNRRLLSSIKVCASDLDGTLLDPDHAPGPGTFEAIAKFQATGGIFAVCTGRDKGSARGILKGLDIDRMPGVYMNGTIVQGLDGELLQAAVVPQEVCEAVTEWGRENRHLSSVLFVVGDDHFVMDRSEEWATYMHRHLLDPDPLQVEGGWEALAPAIPTGVNLMRVLCDPKNMDAVRPMVEALVKGRAACAQSLPTTIDIMAPNTNKATGLRVLLEKLGQSFGVTAAIGDSENDLEMLQSVRVACAMGNAGQKTKAVAHFVMPTNRDSPPGVVALLRSLTESLDSRAAAPQGAPARKRLRVACFGGRNLGSPVARMVGQALLQHREFEEDMLLWVGDEEDGAGRQLEDVINATRENPKYMPGLRFPHNVRATSDAEEAAADADILIFVARRHDMYAVLGEIAGTVRSTATAVVMSKDHLKLVDGRLQLTSHLVAEMLKVKTAVLMGGTLAADVACGHFAEATLGCESAEMSRTLMTLFNRPNFSVSSLPAVQSIELFAMLKAIVALAAGFCDGLGVGANTKAAIVRLGAGELQRLAERLYPMQSSEEALFAACGYTDLIVSSFGRSRNRLCAEAFARDPTRTWEELAREFLGGRDPPSGVRVVRVVARLARARQLDFEFPFILRVQSIVEQRASPASITTMAVPRVRSSRALRVAVMGSGNWGCAIARIVAWNCQRLQDFDERVAIWVREEEVDGERLTDVMNDRHENVKYLPGHELPHNLIAVPDAAEAARGANVLIFVLPHQFLDGLLDSIAGAVAADAMAVSMIKGHIVVQGGGASLKTGSQVIAERLGIGTCSVLNGANVANDVATGNFAEATLGCDSEDQAVLLARLFNTEEFSVRTSPDVLGVELFGGLKNVVALAAGFCDGLGHSPTTKAAVLRRGLLEMALLVRTLFPSSRPETVNESCGIADLLTTCYSGRNRLCAEAFARDPSRSWEEIERDLLGGQKLQGPSCCVDVQALIDHRDLAATFPLMTAVHAAVTKKIPPEEVFSTNGFMNAFAESAD